MKTAEDIFDQELGGLHVYIDDKETFGWTRVAIIRAIETGMNYNPSIAEDNQEHARLRQNYHQIAENLSYYIGLSNRYFSEGEEVRSKYKALHKTVDRLEESLEEAVQLLESVHDGVDRDHLNFGEHPGIYEKIKDYLGK